MRPRERVSVPTRLLGPFGERGKSWAAAALVVDDVRLLGLREAIAARGDADENYLRTTARRHVYRWLWEDAAERLGAVVVELTDGFLAIRIGGDEIRVHEQLVPVDDPVTLKFAGDKPATHRALQDAGLSVPQHLVTPAGRLAEMKAFVRTFGPCVVKPARGGGSGHGVTGGVRTVDDLLRARLRATRWDPGHLLLEAHVDGWEHRVLVFDGEVIGSIRRRPPRVTGDGRRSVLELIRAENARRVLAGGFAGITGLRPSLDAQLTLRSQGLALRAVPEAGRSVQVASATSTSSATESETAMNRGASEAAVRAVAAIGARLASVELFVRGTDHDPDITVLEVNTTPGLAHHYLVRDRRTAEPVAAAVAARLLDRSVTRLARPTG